MEPQVAAAGAGGERRRCDDEDDVELLGLPRPSSSVRRPPDGKKWSHNSGTLSFSSRFCRLDPPADSAAVWTSIGQ